MLKEDECRVRCTNGPASLNRFRRLPISLVPKGGDQVVSIAEELNKTVRIVFDGLRPNRNR